MRDFTVKYRLLVKRARSYRSGSFILRHLITPERKQGQRHLRLQLAIERLANFGFGDLGNQGLFPKKVSQKLE